MDGSIAAHPGQPLALSGALSMTLTHQLRAVHDAILVGIGTVLADNPSLTVRLVEGKNPQPIVADSRLRFPLSANLLCQHPLSPWIAAGEPADAGRQHVLEAAGARVLRLPMNARGQVNLTALLERLGTLGIASVMVEGGARIITSFLAERLVDHIVLTVAPRLVGGAVEAGTRFLPPAMGSLCTIMVCVLAGDDNPAGTKRVTHRRWGHIHSAWALGTPNSTPYSGRSRPATADKRGLSPAIRRAFFKVRTG